MAAHFTGLHSALILGLSIYIAVIVAADATRASREHSPLWVRSNRTARATSHDAVKRSVDGQNSTTQAIITGLRVERSAGEYTNTELDPTTGVLTIVAERLVTFRMFGAGLTADTQIAFTKLPAAIDSECTQDISRGFLPVENPNSSRSALFEVQLALTSNEAG